MHKRDTINKFTQLNSEFEGCVQSESNAQMQVFYLPFRHNFFNNKNSNEMGQTIWNCDYNQK